MSLVTFILLLRDSESLRSEIKVLLSGNAGIKIERLKMKKIFMEK